MSAGSADKAGGVGRVCKQPVWQGGQDKAGGPKAWWGQPRDCPSFEPWAAHRRPPATRPSPAPTTRRLRTGTSQAVPFVAGVIALILQNSTSTSPADMGQLLAASAATGKLSEVANSGFASWDKVGRKGGAL